MMRYLKTSHLSCSFYRICRTLVNKYWCDYNILINSSSFFLAALIKKLMIEPYRGFFYIYFLLQHRILGFRLCRSILFAFLYFMFKSWTLSLCLLPIDTDMCLLIHCQKFVKQICHVNFLSSHVCFSFSCFSLSKQIFM